MNNLSRKKGFFFVTTGAICWGMGGTVAQKLFQEFEISVDWLVSVRLLIAGFLLLMISCIKNNHSHVFGVWKNRKAALQLVVFAIVGMLAVQYTYMASIKHGNAAVATLLQYLSPVMIIIYLLLRKQSIFTRQDVITVLLALGAAFLLTNGSISQLSVPVSAVVWGVLSGGAAAFYTLYAVPLIKKYSSLVIVGWSMVIGEA
ncbi:DMT family transporter [Priestia sp. OVS21]|nr:DMT family transporter [Priestia sp. OVS21]